MILECSSTSSSIFQISYLLTFNNSSTTNGYQVASSIYRSINGGTSVNLAGAGQTLDVTGGRYLFNTYHSSAGNVKYSHNVNIIDQPGAGTINYAVYAIAEAGSTITVPEFTYKFLSIVKIR